MQIETSKLDVGEIELIQWQYGGDMGHFKTALWKAIINSDLNNMGRLALGFPDQIRAYRRFVGEEGYWNDTLVRAGLIKEASPIVTPEEGKH